jgi:hypothetical protein
MHEQGHTGVVVGLKAMAKLLTEVERRLLLVVAMALARLGH